MMVWAERRTHPVGRESIVANANAVIMRDFFIEFKIISIDRYFDISIIRDFGYLFVSQSESLSREEFCGLPVEDNGADADALWGSDGEVLLRCLNADGTEWGRDLAGHRSQST